MSLYFWDQAKLDRNTSEPVIPDKSGNTEGASHSPGPSKGKSIGMKKTKALLIELKTDLDGARIDRN